MPPTALPLEADAALRRFRQFYDELFAIKRILRDGDWMALLGHRAAAPGRLEEEVLLAVRMRLRSAIAAQGFGGAVPPGASAGVDPGYVMAAIADEALLHGVLGWPGRDGWHETPLEAVLYRSRIAGDRIFQAAEALAKPQVRDPNGVAMSILLALEMGFRGRYHAGDPHGEIPRVKERLRRVIFDNTDPSAIAFGSLIAGAAEPLTHHAPDRLPRLRPWGLAIGGVVAAYLLISWLIWRTGVSYVLNTAHSAVSAFQSLPNGP
ncbi:MAG TPA: DotU family type IV/VI secretion system protein [Candidatus Binataceae bacterium]|nr:DotU family type IV/VI secretion system protein [Candidatus Binataceae bacterium]